MRSVLNCGSLALAACMSLAFCGTFAVANAEEKSAGQEKVKLGWKSMDIGKVGKNGSFSEKDGIFTVTGSGEDIWTGGDAFRFAYIPVKGDMELVAEVASLKTSHPWAKTGIMLRANLDFDSRFAFTSVTPNNGAYFFRRTGVVHEVGYSRKQDVKAPCWLKLSRNGNLFTSSISNDGKTWSQIGSVEVAMSTYAYAGLAVCSHKSDVLDTATLKNVSFKGEILPEDKDPAALAAEEKKAANAASGLEQKLAEIDALAAKLRASRASLSFQPRKKLICAGHDMKNMTPLKIREQITQMQQSPFDGLAIRLKGAENGFNSRAFDEERFLEDYQSLAAIEWGHFTDNFIWMHCTSQLEWFNEKDWQGVLANARIMAKAALL